MVNSPPINGNGTPGSAPHLSLRFNGQAGQPTLPANAQNPSDPAPAGVNPPQPAPQPGQNDDMLPQDDNIGAAQNAQSGGGPNQQHDAPGPFQPAAHPLSNGLVADQATIDRTRAAVEVAKTEKRGIALPPLILGYKGNPNAFHTGTRIPPVSASQIPSRTKSKKQPRTIATSHTRCSRHPLGSGQPRARIKSLRYPTKAPSLPDWVVASRLAETLWKKYHAEDRQIALMSHHCEVQNIYRDHTWPIARQYDIRQREIASADHSHSLYGRDTNSLATIILNSHVPAPPIVHRVPAPPAPMFHYSPTAAKRLRGGPAKRPRGGPAHTPSKRGRFEVDTSPQTAGPTPQSQAFPPQASTAMPVGAMPSSQQMEGHSASRGLRADPANTEMAATMPTDVAFAEQATTARVPAPALDPRAVVTPLDVDRIRSALQGLGLLDEWAHIISGLLDGFNVGVDTHVSETYIPENHASTSLAPDFIDSYILDEQAAGRYSRVFMPAELQSLIGPFRTAPLGLVPKPNSNKFRLIQDLSFPRNNPSTSSVNSHVCSDNFPTAWGTFDDASRMVLEAPPGSTAAAFDISAAYRITPTCSSPYIALMASAT
ncbi:hypothetical protein LXA43DRAFT_1069631 [Ganoderma leucocontextum]|nr:hypothetical protein LXA43DRAFT_1069631 [Ganoderma leucocontextum]